MSESIARGIFKVEKYHADEQGNPVGEAFEVLEFKNAYVNAGGVLLLNLLIGAGGTVFSNANAYIGVGDSSTATTATMTDLQASSNKARVAMNSTYPSLSGQTMTWQASIPSGTAEWGTGIQEIGLFNASSGGTMLCRVAQNLGVKGASTVWTINYTIHVP